jgi:uncharacterized protein involved in exopolysaccharide biosynthesis
MPPATPDIANDTETSSALASGNEQAGDGMNLIDLLIVVAERKVWIAKMTAAVIMISVVAIFFLPDRYTATTRILPPQQNQSLASALTGQIAAMAIGGAGKDLGLKNPSTMYIGMLKSETVENALVQRFELAKVYRDSRISDARDDLEKASNIVSGKEGFISISVEDNDRARAATIANAYVDELQKLTQRVAVTEAGQRRLFFEQQVTEAKEKLADAEQELAKTQQKTGIIQLDGQAKAIIDSVAQIRAEIASKEVQLQAMRSFGTEHNPDVFVANQELAGLRGQLTKLEQQQNSGGGDLQVPTGKIPEVGLEYLRRLRDVKYSESIFELLAKQYEMAKLDEGRQGTVIQVVDPASEPDKKSSPHRGLLILAAAIVGFVGSSLWVMLLGVMSVSKSNPDFTRLRTLKRVLLSEASH